MAGSDNVKKGKTTAVIGGRIRGLFQGKKQKTVTVDSAEKTKDAAPLPEKKRTPKAAPESGPASGNEAVTGSSPESTSESVCGSVSESVPGAASEPEFPKKKTPAEVRTEQSPEEEPAAEAKAEQSPEEISAEVEKEGLSEIKAERPGEKISLDSLAPADVFGYFREIAAIPHGSFHTQALSDYLESFAAAHHLACSRDESGNLIICRPASAGCGNAAPIALQGHIDMVCEKESSNPIDMEKEAITLQTDGRWLWADRTTLGGDDGIAAAIMMALLSDETIQCPPLECIFTVDEEVGLLGANAIDLSELRSRRMINLDSEKEGVITAGCAGGAEAVCALSGKRRMKQGQMLRIEVSGLLGGHSGEMIGAGRANADLLVGRLLHRLEGTGKYCISEINGGNRDNAIPREAAAEILFTGKVHKKNIEEAVHRFTEEIAREYNVTDPGIVIRAFWDESGEEACRSVFSRKASKRMVRFLLLLPNGVIEYLPHKREVPQTSLSLGIVETGEDGICLHSLVRSSVNSQKQMLLDRIEALCDVFGASMEIRGAYPAWEYKEESLFRDLAVRIRTEVTGRETEVIVTHGGLECGILAAKVPGLDCISIGPDMEGIHTPAERLNIASSANTYAFVKTLLAACASADDGEQEPDRLHL